MSSSGVAPELPKAQRPLKITPFIAAGVSILLIVAALFIFKPPPSAPPVLVEESTETLVATNTETLTPVPSATETETFILATETLTPTPSDTPTPSITPTFAILTGRVNVDRANCRYGPGPYIGLAGLIRGNPITVVGRDVTSEWLYVNFPSNTGGVTKCWLEAESVDLKGGDVASLENFYPGKYKIPFWKDYQPPQNIDITRSGNSVNIVWEDPNLLELGDRESARSPRFIIEAWVCKRGALEFTVLGMLDNTSLIIEDEAGCAEPSSGLLYSAGKHGYSTPVNLPWPAP